MAASKAITEGAKAPTRKTKKRRARRQNGEGGISGPDARGRYRGILELPPEIPGKRNQRTFWGRSVAEVLDKLEEAKVELRMTGTLMNRTVTVAEYYEQVWDHQQARRSYKPARYSSVTGMFRRWILPQMGRKRIAELRPSHILELYSIMERKGMASGSIASAHWIMSRFFDDARKEYKIPNVIRDVDPPKVTYAKRGALPVKDAMAILESADEFDDGSKWWVTLLGGLRQGERIGATRDSIDLKAREFVVQWSLTDVPHEHGCDGDCGHPRPGNCPQKRAILMPGLEHQHVFGRYYLVRPKSGKVRRFPLIDPVYDRLVEYLDRTADDVNPSSLLWHRTKGRPWSPIRDEEDWRRVLHAAGVITAEQMKAPKDRAPGTPLTPTTHYARHTTVTLLMELGVPDAVIGSIVGHIDATTTAMYQHPTAVMEREAMRRLSEMLVRAAN